MVVNMENQSISKLCFFRLTTLQIGQFARVLEKVTTKYYDGKVPFINLDRDLPDQSHVQESGIDIARLEQVCDFAEQAISIHFYNSTINNIYVRAGEGYFTIEVDAAEARAVQDVFNSFVIDLALVQVESPAEHYARIAKNIRPEHTLPGLIKRVEALESVLLNPEEKISCFLSFVFTDENKPVAEKVEKFLETLDVVVTSGEAYEPRQINEKIQAKLAENPDMIVLLIVDNGESFWTRDEIVSAKDRGAFVVPIVQDGSHFTPGIFGDLERIPFDKSHIGDAFAQLAEAVRFVRARKGQKKVSRLS